MNACSKPPGLQPFPSIQTKLQFTNLLGLFGATLPIHTDQTAVYRPSWAFWCNPSHPYRPNCSLQTFLGFLVQPFPSIQTKLQFTVYKPSWAFWCNPSHPYRPNCSLQTFLGFLVQPFPPIQTKLQFTDLLGLFGVTLPTHTDQTAVYKPWAFWCNPSHPYRPNCSLQTFLGFLVPPFPSIQTKLQFTDLLGLFGATLPIHTDQTAVYSLQTFLGFLVLPSGLWKVNWALPWDWKEQSAAH